MFGQFNLQAKNVKAKKLRRLKINKFDLRKFGKIKKKFKDYNAVIILGGLVGDPITKKYKLLSESINKEVLQN